MKTCGESGDVDKAQEVLGKLEGARRNSAAAHLNMRRGQAESSRAIAAGQPLPDMVFRQPTRDMPGLLCLNRPEEDAQNPVPPSTKLIAHLEVMKREPTLHDYYLEVLEQLSQRAPQDPAVLVCLGMRALLEDKDYSQAANDLSQAIEHGNEEATTFLYLGQALARSGRDSEALRTFQRGVAAYPYDVPLWRGVATEYLRLYDRQRALEAMRKHLELFPEDAPMRDLMKKVEGYEP